MATRSTGLRAQYVIASPYRLSDAGLAALRADFLDEAQEHNIAGDQFHIIKKAQSEVLILSCPEEYGDQYGGIARVLLINSLRSLIRWHEEWSLRGEGLDEFIKIFEEATMKITDAALIDTKYQHKNTTERLKPTEPATHLNLQMIDRQCIYGDHKTGHTAFLPKDLLPPRSKAIIEQCLERNKLTVQTQKLLFLRSVIREDEDQEQEEYGMYTQWRHIEVTVDPLDPLDPAMVSMFEQGIKFHDIELVTAAESQDSSNIQDVIHQELLASSPLQSHSTSTTSCSTRKLSTDIGRQMLDPLEQKLKAATINHVSKLNAAKPPSAGFENYNSPLQPASCGYKRSACSYLHQVDDPDSDNESFYTAAGETLYTQNAPSTTADVKKSEEDESSDDDTPLDVLALVSGPKRASASVINAQAEHKKTPVQEKVRSNHASTPDTRSKAPQLARTAAYLQSGPMSRRPTHNEMDRFGIKGLARKEAELRNHRRRGNIDDEYQSEWDQSSIGTIASSTPLTYTDTVVGGAEPWAHNVVKETQASLPPSEGLLIDVSNSEEFPVLSRQPAQIGVNIIDFDAPPLQPVQFGEQSRIPPGAICQSTRGRLATSTGSSNVAALDKSLDRLSPSPLKKPILRRTMGQKARKQRQSGFERLVKEVLAKLEAHVTITIDFGIFAFQDSHTLSAVYDQHELASAFRSKTNTVAQLKSIFVPQLLQAQEAVQIISISFDNDNLLLDKSIVYDEEAYFTITVKLSDESEETIHLAWTKQSGFCLAPFSSNVSISVHNPGHTWDAQVSVGTSQKTATSPIAVQILQSLQVKHLQNGEKSVSFQTHGYEDKHVVKVLQVTMVERFIRRSENLMLPSKHEKVTKHMSVGWMVFRETSLNVTSTSLIDGSYTAVTDILSERYKGTAGIAQWQARMLLSGKVNQQSLVQISEVTDLMHHLIGRVCYSLDGLGSATELRQREKKKKKEKKVAQPQKFW